MVLNTGQRVTLTVLRTWAPFGTRGSDDVVAAVDTLNSMLDRAHLTCHPVVIERGKTA